jgi:hypothetical protein
MVVPTDPAARQAKLDAPFTCDVCLGGAVPPAVVGAAAGSTAVAKAKTGHKRQKCEDCGRKQGRFDLQTGQKQRWCSGCAEKHEGVANCAAVMCEDCGGKQASSGVMTDGGGAQH